MTRLFTRRSLNGLGTLAAILAVLVWVAGCGGGDGGGGIVPPPPVQTATVRGTVVPADDTTGGLGGATVSALGVAAAGVGTAQTAVLATTTADTHGNFVLNNVPVGDVTIVADTLNEAQYGSQSIPGLHLNRNDDVSLTITVLPVGSPTPTVVYLSPNSAEIDPHGQVAFTGSVASSDGMLTVTPSYYLTGGIGVVDRNGQFIASQTGTGKLWAVCGTAQASATINVTAARAPQVTFCSVSPLELTATGGKVNVTIAAHDGDGIAQVVAELYKPDTTHETIIMELDPRTTGTYWLPEVMDDLGETGRWLIIPGNSNTPDAFGHQEAQRYSIRIVVTDGSGATTTAPPPPEGDDFFSVVVNGIDTPPPPI